MTADEERELWRDALRIAGEAEAEMAECLASRDAERARADKAEADLALVKGMFDMAVRWALFYGLLDPAALIEDYGEGDAL